MARYLSEDLRIRVIEAVEAGASRRRAAERFVVSVSSAMQGWRPSGAWVSSVRVVRWWGYLVKWNLSEEDGWCSLRHAGPPPTLDSPASWMRRMVAILA